MRIEQVACTLYTTRDYIKEPSAIAQTFKKVRNIGYQAVQVSGMGPIAEEELKRMLDGEGLTLCATHEPPDTILDEPQKVVDRLAKLDCKYTAYPFPKEIDFEKPKDVKRLLDGLNRCGQIMRKAGQVLTYHNHGEELNWVNGKVILDMIYDGTDPQSLQGEIDTCWVEASGGNVLEWCKKLANRLPLLHVKDYKGKNEKNRPNFEEIGYGQMEWKPIIVAAGQSGCEWFIVEHDTNWENNDPFQSLKMSFEYIRDNLCE